MCIIRRNAKERYDGISEVFMLICPFCDEPLKTRTPDGWICSCGEEIPLGYERDDEENCETCVVKDCPRRR